jgi:hypothetical protein
VPSVGNVQAVSVKTIHETSTSRFIILSPRIFGCDGRAEAESIVDHQHDGSIIKNSVRAPCSNDILHHTMSRLIPKY